MKYESVQQAREALKKLEQTQAAYNHALGVLYLGATTAAPPSHSTRSTVFRWMICSDGTVV